MIVFIVFLGGCTDKPKSTSTLTEEINSTIDNNETNKTKSKIGTNSILTKRLKKGEESTSDTLINEVCEEVDGVVIYSGVDINSNAILDVSERKNAQVLCNGKDGRDGVNGTNGKDGLNGRDGINGTSANYTILELSEGEENCPSGGIKIAVGSTNKYFCNESTEVSTRDITGLGSLKGKITNEINSEGKIWLVPSTVATSVRSTLSVENEITKPIVKPQILQIEEDLTYEISLIPSGQYSLVYVDTQSKKSIKIDNVFIFPNNPTIKDITEVVESGKMTLSVKGDENLSLSNITIIVNELDVNQTALENELVTFEDLAEGSYSVTIGARAVTF